MLRFGSNGLSQHPTGTNYTGKGNIMKAKIKRLLKAIDTDRARGLVPTDHDIAMAQAYWLKLFGSGGCSHYPYLTWSDMVKDLRSEI